jgi:polysaccharide pyruvyl transferase WcaK-like protein
MTAPYTIIGLLDHMGFGNMGDAAIHESFVRNIKARVPDARIIAFSQNPEDTRTRHQLVAYPISRPQPGRTPPKQPRSRGILSALKGLTRRATTLLRDCIGELRHLQRSCRIVKSLDLLVIAGGGQLCDLWWFAPYNVFKFCFLAKLSGTPVAIIGVGADRLNNPSAKHFARWAVRLADYASFRDIESQALIRELGVTKQTHVCPDPAYGTDVGDVMPSLRQDHATLTVGINPMGFCDPRVWPRREQAAYDRYLTNLTHFSLWLLRQHCKIELFTSDIGTDQYALIDLKERIMLRAPAALADRLVCRPVLTLPELLQQLTTFDVVITPKFHGLIFSHLLEIPTIALSYMPKLDHLMRAVGHERYCLDIASFEVCDLVAAFHAVLSEANALRSLFRKATAAYAEALQREFDRVFLTSPTARHAEAHCSSMGSITVCASDRAAGGCHSPSHGQCPGAGGDALRA